MSDYHFELLRVPVENLHMLLDPDFDRNDRNTIRLHDLRDEELVELWRLLPNSKPEFSLLDVPISAPDDGIMSFSTPPNFAMTLRELRDRDISRIANLWSGTNGLSNWLISDLENSIHQLRSFARAAHNEDQIIVYMHDM